MPLFTFQPSGHPSQKELEEAIAACFQKAMDLGYISQKTAAKGLLFPIPVEFFPKGRAAGHVTAKRQAGRVTALKLSFSLDAMERYPYWLLTEVVPHELAHIVDFLEHGGIWKHSRPWKQCCMSLGGSGATRHTKELTKARRTRKHIYTLPSGDEVMIGNKHHSKFQSEGILPLRGKVNGVMTRFCLSDCKYIGSKMI